MRGGIVVYAIFLGLMLSQRSAAQIPRACADRQSLEQMTCCPVTDDGVCGEDAERGECGAVNFERHRNDTTDVRVNWPHYYTNVCKCSGNFGGYDCSRCAYGYYGKDCASRAIIPRKPVRDFSEEEWEDFVAILGRTKTWDSGYVVVLEEQVPGAADLNMANVSLYNFMIWNHHYAAKDSFSLLTPTYLDYAHNGPAFFTWHRWWHVFLEAEIQAMLEAMGREDYFKFRLPFWDWRREIQTSYGLPSEQLFTFNRFGETRNISNRPVVFGDIVDGWNTICHFTPEQICDPNIPTGGIQRCPFIGNPILCHSSNPDWPTMQEVNRALEAEFYIVEPYDRLSVNSVYDRVDFNFTMGVEACRQEGYCSCVPTGDVRCEGIPDDATGVTVAATGVHPKVHYLLGLGSSEVIPADLQGSMYDVASSPNDPIFILHHLMVDCILVEWVKSHPDAEYPDSDLVRDGHKKDDYIRSFFPLVTNGEAFYDTKEFGYYCDLPNLGSTEAETPSPLETRLSFFITGSSVEVCVETKTPAIIKLILRDSKYGRQVAIVKGFTGCGMFGGLPAGEHSVRAVSRELPGRRRGRYLSEFFKFSTN